MPYIDDETQATIDRVEQMRKDARALEEIDKGKAPVKETLPDDTDPKNLNPDNTDLEEKLGDLTPATIDDTDPNAEKLELTKVEPKETGVADVDEVGKLLASKEVKDADKIIADFAATGELTLEAQASIVEALGDSVAKLVIDKLNTVADNARQKAISANNEIKDYALAAFEGAEDRDKTWGEIQEFARSEDSGFSNDDLTVFNAMLKAGGLQAKLAIDKIQSVYYSLDSSTSQADLLAGDSYNAGNSLQPLTRVEYTQQLRVAINEHGENSSQVATLNRRRELGMSRGI